MTTWLTWIGLLSLSGVVYSEAVQPEELGSSLSEMITFAALNSPKVRASYEQSLAAEYDAKSRGRLPDPTLSYAYFAQSVETRVGPQRHRFSVHQNIPWPTEIFAAGKSRRLLAQNAQLQYQAQLLGLSAVVSRAYFERWQLDELHHIRVRYDSVLESMVDVLRAKLEISQATLSDLSQAELAWLRHRDSVEQYSQDVVHHDATLRAHLGLGHETELSPPTDAPQVVFPKEPLHSILAKLSLHPLSSGFEVRAEAYGQRAKQSLAKGLPKFRVGLDVIETGEAQNPTLINSGQDAVIISGSLSLPLFLGAYRNEQKSHLAMERAVHLEYEAWLKQREAQVTKIFTRLQSTVRRYSAFHNEWIPKAEQSYDAALGEFESAQLSFNDLLAIQRQVFELEAEALRHRVKAATDFAELESLVGTTLEYENKGALQDE